PCTTLFRAGAGGKSGGARHTPRSRFRGHGALSTDFFWYTPASFPGGCPRILFSGEKSTDPRRSPVTPRGPLSWDDHARAVTLPGMVRPSSVVLTGRRRPRGPSGARPSAPLGSDHMTDISAAQSSTRPRA